jgi:pyruvate/2-oxoglutarate/acetoin dehydrogenase E1 component
MTNTLTEVPSSKKLEMPVCEELQMGITLGMAVRGRVPVSIYPRWNFLLLGANQLVNHIDKLSDYSCGRYSPKVIIRTSIGSERPMHPQHQHVGDFTDAFCLMLKNVEVIRLDEPDQIFDSYKRAYEREDGKSTLLVEWGDFYNEK